LSGIAKFDPELIPAEYDGDAMKWIAMPSGRFPQSARWKQQCEMQQVPASPRAQRIIRPALARESSLSSYRRLTKVATGKS
jgi:hypothetical protein